MQERDRGEQGLQPGQPERGSLRFWRDIALKFPIWTGGAILGSLAAIFALQTFFPQMLLAPSLFFTGVGSMVGIEIANKVVN